MGGSPPLRTSEKYYYLVFCDGIHYVFLTPDDALKHAKRVAKESKQNARVIQALNMYDVRRKNPGKAEVSSGGSCLCGVDFHVCGGGDYSDAGWTQTPPKIRLEPTSSGLCSLCNAGAAFREINETFDTEFLLCEDCKRTEWG